MLVGFLIRFVVGGALGGGLACGPKIVESHRQFAEEWCSDWMEFVSECSEAGPWSEDLTERERAECEADEWWDWTDECGDLRWAWHQCMFTIPCDQWSAHNHGENRFCEAEEDEYRLNCDYTQDHRD